ncbi:zinc finger protein 184-like isoform X2 [Anthonomus grandis grandis]|nr:zinc finger protein 184-like isoform X2 [Anthonomus grandis grandis]
MRKENIHRKQMFICSLHFDNESILQQSMKIYIDGEEVLLQRQRQRLKKDAMPTIFPKKQEVGSLKAEPEQHHSIEKFQQKQKVSITPLPTSDVSSEAIVSIPETEKEITNPEPNVQTEIYFPKPEVALSQNYESKDLITDWQNNSLINSVLQHSEPQHWGMTVGNSGLYFNYVGDKLKKFEGINLAILVKYDMSVEIIAQGPTATYPVLNPITCFSDLILAMEKVMQADLCTGSDCADVFYVRKPKSGSTLCKPCQKERRLRLDRVKRKHQRMQHRILNPRQMTEKNLRRKYLRTLKKAASNESTKHDFDPFWDSPDIDISHELILDKTELSDNGNLTDTNDSTSKEDSTPADGDSSKSCSKIPEGLLQLFDISSQNSRCLVVNKDMSTEETNDLVSGGINVIHMSSDPNKKKRIIYVGRDVSTCFKQCPYCNISFMCVAEADDHKLAHKKGKIKLDEKLVGRTIFRCTKCPAEFVVQKDFKVHSFDFHKDRKPFVCSCCKRKFKGFKELQKHSKYTFNGSCRRVCPKCNKDFKTSSLFMEHMTASKSLSTCDIVKCKQCKEWMIKSILTDHMKTHPKTTRCLLCPKCGKSVTHLSAHMRRTHLKLGRIACSKCGRVCNGRSSLSVHMKTVHGEAQFICDQCPRMFKHIQYLKKHVQVHHTGTKTEKPSSYPCEKCGVTFKHGFGLRFHIRIFHEGVKNFVCDLCGERFARNDYLRRHKKYHDLYVKNVCDICKTSFRTSSYLKIHMEGGHDENGQPLFRRGCRNASGTGFLNRNIKRSKIPPSMKPKACPICHKVLSNSASLRMHYRGHLRLLHRKCPKCDSLFASQSTLDTHLKRHDDPRYDSRCRVCHIYQYSKEDMKKHMETTHKNMKHKCHICEEVFGRKHLLTNHIHRKHPEECEKRREVWSALIKQKAEDVPLEDYKSTRTHRKSNFQENDVNLLLNQLTSESKADDIFIEVEEEPHWDGGEQEIVEEEIDDCKITISDEGIDYDLFGQDYDSAEATLQLKQDLENGF